MFLTVFPIMLGSSKCDVPVKGIDKSRKRRVYHTKEKESEPVLEVRAFRVCLHCGVTTRDREILTKGNHCLIKRRRDCFSFCNIPLWK